MIGRKAREYCNCVDRIMMIECTSMNRRLPERLKNKADGRAFVRDTEHSIQEHLKGKRSVFFTGWRHFVDWVNGSTESSLSRTMPQSSAGKLVMSRNCRRRFIQWLQERREMRKRTAQVHASMVDALMATITDGGRATPTLDTKADGQAFVRVRGAEMTACLKRKDRIYVTGWRHWLDHLEDSVPLKDVVVRSIPPKNKLFVAPRFRAEFIQWQIRTRKLEYWEAQQYCDCVDKVREGEREKEKGIDGMGMKHRD